MPDTLLLTTLSFLFIVSGGFLGISLARLTRVHPAYFFLLFGGALAATLPFVLPQRSLISELAELGAIFVVFLAALETQWDARFSWRLNELVTALLTQLAVAMPVAALFYFWFKIDMTAAFFTGLVAAAHAPERRRQVVGDSFRHNLISGEAGFFGFVSEVSLLAALALLGAFTQRETISADLLQVAVGILLILILLITFVPQMLRLLLRRVSEESYAIYYLMLVLLIGITLLMRRAAIEPLLGAFAAGFVLARFVTEGSKVLERLRFTGHSLLVPSFFIMFGFTLVLTGPVNATGLYTAAAITLATWFLRFIAVNLLNLRAARARFSVLNLMRKNPFVMVLLYVGAARGVIPVHLLQPLLLYLVANEILCMLLGLSEPQGETPAETKADARVLLPVSNPETMLPLLNLASHLGHSGRAARIHPVNVVSDTGETEAKIRSVEAQFNEIIPLYAARDQVVQLSTRIDNNRIRAVARTARELLADRILLGLGAIPTLQRPQGYSFLESLSEIALQNTILAAHLQADLALTSHINVIVANRTLLESREVWLPLVVQIARRLHSEIVFFGDQAVLAEIEQHMHADERSTPYSTRAGQMHAGLDLVTLDANANAFSIAVLERTFRYPDEKIHARLPEMMLRAFSDRNFMLLYPAVAAGIQIKKPRSAWRKIKRFMGFS